MIRQMIERLPESYYRHLFNCVPNHLKTSNIWLAACTKYPGFMSQVPANVATQSFYENVVDKHSLAIRHVPRQYRTTKLCLTAINATGGDYWGPFMLEYVPYESQTEEMIIASIKIHGGHELASAAFQTRDICMAAVASGPIAIKWVNDQTFDICDMAIRHVANRGDIRDVVLSIRNHTAEICIRVLHIDPMALVYLRNHSREVCLEAIRIADVSEVSQILDTMREHSLEVCIATYRKSRLSYLTIRDVGLRQRMIRLIIANDILIPLRGVNLSTALLTELCGCLMDHKFPSLMFVNPQLLTPMQLWALVAKVKHFE